MSDSEEVDTQPAEVDTQPAERSERVRPTITREMRLVSRLIAKDRKVPDASLAQYIARCRNPATGQQSWNEISHALTPILGEIITEGTLRKWAAAYGIPDRGPRIKITPEEFAAGIEAAGIALD
jgi:hypothetical protein